MNIRPSAAIRQNYNEIAELCRKTAEPIYLTKNGEGDLAESLIPDTELTVALFVDGFDMNDDAFRTTLTRANGWEDDIDRMFAYNQAGVAYEYTPMEMDANGNAIADGGSIVIELGLADGSALSLQSTLDGVYPFMDTAFAAWCMQTGLKMEECSFYDPSKSWWFPHEEEA